MRERRDLTRWNRAGLKRFRYIDGNAVTFLEDLRVELSRRFADPVEREIKWESLTEQTVPLDGQERELRWELLPGKKKIPKEESQLDRRNRLVRQYREERPDYGWEIVRAFARSLHILTEYVDAYANEGFLSTATQWDNVRRLVEMLDYHPAPPSSAITSLVFQAKANEHGILPRGFAVKNKPREGNPTVVFEILDDLEIDAALNELRIKGWNTPSIRFKDLLMASPHAMGGRSAKCIQGVGDKYINELGNPSVFELSRLDPFASEARISHGWFWECVTKAKMVMNFELGPQAFDSILESSLKEIVETSDQELALKTSQPLGEVKKLKEKLREIEIALDNPDFVSIRLKEFIKENFTARRTEPIWIAEKPQAVQADKVAMILKAETSLEASAVGIQRVIEETGEIIIERLRYQDAWKDWVIGHSRLLLNPAGSHDAWLAGSKVVRFVEGHGLVADDVIAWKVGASWKFREVIETDARSVRLKGGSVPEEETKVYQAFPIDKIDGEYIYQDGYRAGAYKSGGILTPITTADQDDPEWGTSTTKGDKIWQLKLSSIESVYIVGKDMEPFGTTEDPPENAFSFDGDGKDFQTGDWVVGKYLFRGGSELYHPAQIDNIEREKDHFNLRLIPAENTLIPSERLKNLQAVHGPFQTVISPSAYLLSPEIKSGGSLKLDVEDIEPVRELLVKDRQILVENLKGKGSSSSKLVTVIRADIENKTIHIQPPLELEDEFTSGDTVLRANVMKASHGETKPEAILGSGDASVSNQTFLLEASGVSFIPDSTFPSGVRADIQVRVGERTWQQQASLNTAEPADPYYKAQVTEKGYLQIQLGDGRYGRRLPTGTNNVRISYRLGSGEDGNVDSGSLTKPGRPHPALDSVRQPFAASGGNALEPVESLRENAPATVLTLERAVSVSDFTHLATRHSSVWTARAFSRQNAFQRNELVQVVIIPAGGKQSPQVERDIAEYLQANTISGVHVMVQHFEPVEFHLNVKIRVKYEEFDPKYVEQEVRKALEGKLALRRARLGRPLYRSTIFQVVEGVTGVENSFCEIGRLVLPKDKQNDLITLKVKANDPVTVRAISRSSDGVVRVVWPQDNQAIYIREESPLIEVKAEKFEL